jgi:hypothetical protein
MQPPNKSAASHPKSVGLAVRLRTLCYEAFSARARVCYGAKVETDAPPRQQNTDAQTSKDRERK